MSPGTSTGLCALSSRYSDQELVLAQGQENSVRADLSFIERARFAQSLVELNYGRDVVMSALAVDKTTVSRMLSVTTRFPSAVIEAIGPAPGIGRDRWVELAGHVEAQAALPGLEELFESEAFCAAGSDDRFNLIADLLKTGEGTTPRNAGKERGQGPRHDVQSWAPSEGDTLVTLKHRARSCVMNIDQRQAPGFGDFLLRHMDRLYREYQVDWQD